MIVIGVFDNDPNQYLNFIVQEGRVFIDIFESLEKTNPNLRVKPRFNIGVEDIIKLIDENHQDLIWFHFSGHHDKGIGIRATNGSLQSLTKSLTKCPNLKGVFINGCSSKDTIEELLENVPICIGTVKPVYDSIAYKFSESLYSKFKNLDNWLDYNKLHQVFNESLPNTYDIINVDIEGTNRGGGSKEDFLTNFYFISEQTESKKHQFEDGDLLYEDKIQRYLDAGGIVGYLNKNILNFDVHYWRNPPEILSRMLKPFIAPNIGFVYKKIGIERYTLIKEYVFAYLDICRYSILSILWKEIKNGLVKIDNTQILELFKSVNNFSDNNIQTLIKLCDEIIQRFGTKTEIDFIEQLPKSLFNIKESINYISEQENIIPPNHKVYWKAELLLQQVIVNSQFLNNYLLQSIFSKYYKNIRSSDTIEYEVDIRYANGDLLREKEEDIGLEFAYNHSLYICQEYGKKKIVINLTPFYYDENSSDQSASKISFYVLDSFNANNGTYIFKELPESINEQGGLKHIRRQPTPSQPIRHKNLAEQLNYLIESLTD